MKKYKVVATLITVRTLTRTIEAKDMYTATQLLLDDTDKNNWITKAELKTIAK